MIKQKIVNRELIKVDDETILDAETIASQIAITKAIKDYDLNRICGLNLIAQVKAACKGDLDRVARVVKLGGFVNCTEEFCDHPEVINGASNLMVDVFGDKGTHSRFAVGVNSLPRGVAVEVDGIFELD